MPQTGKMEIRIRNDLADIDAANDMLDAFGRKHTLSQKAVVQLKVILDEILSNVVKYAWPEGGEHEAELQLSLRGDYVEIRVRDNGRPFDPLQFERVPAARVERKRPLGGRGISMVRKLVDQIDYSRNDDHNTLVLSKCVRGRKQG